MKQQRSSKRRSRRVTIRSAHSAERKPFTCVVVGSSLTVGEAGHLSVHPRPYPARCNFRRRSLLSSIFGMNFYDTRVVIGMLRDFIAASPAAFTNSDSLFREFIIHPSHSVGSGVNKERWCGWLWGRIRVILPRLTSHFLSDSAKLRWTFFSR